MFKGILVEFVITFVLVLVVYAAAADESNTVKGSAPLAIGLAITIGHLFAVSYLQSQEMHTNIRKIHQNNNVS